MSRTTPRRSSNPSSSSASGSKGTRAIDNAAKSTPPSQRRRRSADPAQRRDPERTRQLILDAASEEFGSVGYNNARVVRIAERAGVAHQLITYHFGGKRGLFETLSKRWASESGALVTPDKTADETIADLVHLANDSTSWSRILLNEGQQDLDHAGLLERLMPSLVDARERQARGEFPADVDAGVVTLVFFAATMAATTLPHVARALSPVSPSDPTFVDYYADQLARLVRHLRSGPE